MKKRNVAKALMGAFVLAIGSLAVAPEVAQAAPAAFGCQSGQVCLYENMNFTGSVHVFTGGTESNLTGLRYTNGDGMNDSVSSVENLSGHDVEMFQDINGGGFFIEVAPHTTRNQLGSTTVFGPFGPPFTSNFDNAASDIAIFN